MVKKKRGKKIRSGRSKSGTRGDFPPLKPSEIGIMAEGKKGPNQPPVQNGQKKKIWGAETLQIVGGGKENNLREISV